MRRWNHRLEDQMEAEGRRGRALARFLKGRGDMSDTEIPTPFKCVGGKAKLVQALLKLAPTSFDGYCEPFVGGGALYRALATSSALTERPVRLSDLNAGVTTTWRDIQRNYDVMEQKLHDYECAYNGKPDEERQRLYLQERSRWNSGGVTGARHIFLRNTAFNGLWRENRSGGFNVPWGRYKKFCSPDLLQLHRRLQESVDIRAVSYQEACDELPSGWWVYVDPPYLGEFSNYTRRGFTLEDHVDLMTRCHILKERGVHVLYSNRWSPQVINLLQKYWPSASFLRLVVQQTMAAKVAARGAVEELVAL